MLETVVMLESVASHHRRCLSAVKLLKRLVNAAIKEETANKTHPHTHTGNDAAT